MNMRKFSHINFLKSKNIQGLFWGDTHIYTNIIHLFGKAKTKKKTIDPLTIDAINTYNKEIIANEFCKHWPKAF